MCAIKTTGCILYSCRCVFAVNVLSATLCLTSLEVICMDLYCAIDVQHAVIISIISDLFILIRILLNHYHFLSVGVICTLKSFIWIIPLFVSFEHPWHFQICKSIGIFKSSCVFVYQVGVNARLVSYTKNVFDFWLVETRR